MRRRVVVTGMGIVSSLGVTEDEVWTSLKAEKNKVRYLKEWEVYESMRVRIAAPVSSPLREYPRKVLRSMGRVAHLALMATDDAIDDSGLEREALKDGRTGIAYGSSFGNVPATLDFYRFLVDKNSKSVSTTAYIKCMPQTCAANLSVYYGLKGRLITTNTACTSGSQSIGFAYEAIQSGRQDVMLAGGSEELSPADVVVFDSIFSASTDNDSPELTPRAYDKTRNGLVIGEGAATLVLEEYEHAVARGAHIYAELVGFATNSDGTHITHPNQSTMAEVMRMAIADAGLKPDAIGYINMHGTATIAGDIVETQAVKEVFPCRIPVSTLKGYTGHTLGACGSIEAWVSIMMMNRGWFCPNLNLKEVDPECADLDYILSGGRELQAEYIMSNNFAFGGINTSLIFKRA